MNLLGKKKVSKYLRHLKKEPWGPQIDKNDSNQDGKENEYINNKPL